MENSTCDKTKKKIIVTKLRISNCDKTENSNCDKTQIQIVTKLKTSNCDKIYKLKL